MVDLVEENGAFEDDLFDKAHTPSFVCCVVKLSFKTPRSQILEEAVNISSTTHNPKHFLSRRNNDQSIGNLFLTCRSIFGSSGRRHSTAKRCFGNYFCTLRFVLFTSSSFALRHQSITLPFTIRPFFLIHHPPPTTTPNQHDRPRPPSQQKKGPNRGLNPGPPAPKAGIIPLDHQAMSYFSDILLKLPMKSCAWFNFCVCENKHRSNFPPCSSIMVRMGKPVPSC